MKPKAPSTYVPDKTVPTSAMRKLHTSDEYGRGASFVCSAIGYALKYLNALAPAWEPLCFSPSTKASLTPALVCQLEGWATSPWAIRALKRSAPEASVWKASGLSRYQAISLQAAQT
jgi:hypothetical protein